MEMDAPMTVEPLLHLGMFVRGVVIEDDVDVRRWSLLSFQASGGIGPLAQRQHYLVKGRLEFP